MSFANLIAPVTRTVTRMGLVLSKHSPAILIGVGATGLVVAGISAARAAYNYHHVVEEYQDGVAAADDRGDEMAANEATKYFWIDTAKTFGPAVVLGGLSVAAIIGGHSILVRRFVGLSVAYGSLERTFEAWKSRAQEIIGDEKFAEVKQAFLNEDQIRIDERNDDGTPTSVSPLSEYVKVFDETNRLWEKSPEYNMVTLRRIQRYMNDRLKIRGHVFLNEVLDELALPRTQAGAVVGWIYGVEGEDSVIDFGMCEYHSPEVRDFTNGYNPAIVLNFNVDGTIWDRI